MSDVRLAWPVAALLGEGPVWMPDEQALRFVDIKAGRLHRFDPATRDCQTIDVSGAPSFLVGAADGHMLVGSAHGIYPFDGMRLGACSHVIPQPAHNRTNDATVDMHGRLWFGTMDDTEQRPTGTLWCLDGGRLQHVGGAAIVTNGPALTADGRTLFHVDSSTRTIWRHEVQDSATLGEGELFLRLTERDGYPDGIVVDSENCLWVALWDGWGVRRYAPDGALLQHVPLPCARVTKIAFGGPALRTAYVTTARVGLTGAALAAQPLAGSLFEFEAPAPGTILPRVSLA